MGDHPEKSDSREGLEIIRAGEADSGTWDAYVHAHPRASMAHLFGWKEVIEKTYGHETFYLMAVERSSGENACPRERLRGLVPLAHLKHVLFGNELVSMPFLDTGGILADDAATEQALWSAVLELAESTGAGAVELRQPDPLRFGGFHRENSPHVIPECRRHIRDPVCSEAGTIEAMRPLKKPVFRHSGPDPESNKCLKTLDTDGSRYPVFSDSCLMPDGVRNDRKMSHAKVSIRTDKVRMFLPLPSSSEELMDSFKSKLRSQIRKPIRERLNALTGGSELLDNFYRVFSVNMRELGSPVHAKAFFSNIVQKFSEEVNVILVRSQHGAPVAGGLTIGFKKTLFNPWASSLKQYSSLSPNMLLYWQMLSHACEGGYDAFDFGRSSINDSTYRFKAQWGPRDMPLYWYHVALKGKRKNPGQSPLLQKASQCWKHLPVPVANRLGPKIRKHIGL